MGNADNALKFRNAEIFRQKLAEKKLGPPQFYQALAAYVKRTCPDSASQQVTLSNNLHKELNRVKISDKVLLQGLAILEFSNEEIAAILATR